MSAGVRRSLSLLFLYIMNVIEEIGTDSSIELLIKAAKEQGNIFAREFRKEYSSDLSPLEVAEKVYCKFMKDVGAEVHSYERGNDSSSFIIYDCPFFDAFLDVGINCGIFLEGLCSNLTLPTVQTALSNYGINVRVEATRCKNSSEDFCIEKVSLVN